MGYANPLSGTIATYSAMPSGEIDPNLHVSIAREATA